MRPINFFARHFDHSPYAICQPTSNAQGINIVDPRSRGRDGQEEIRHGPCCLRSIHAGRAHHGRSAARGCGNLSALVCRLRRLDQLRLSHLRAMQDDRERDQYILRAQPVVRATQSCWMGAAMKRNECVAVPPVMRKLHHAGRPLTRYRARAFDSDRHPFKAGRSAIRVRAKNGYLLTSNLSTNSSCSLASGQSSARASEIIHAFNVTRLFSSLFNSCARLLTSGSAEYFRQRLDPVVSASGIEIEGLGRRLVRDAYAGRFANGLHNL